MNWYKVMRIYHSVVKLRSICSVVMVFTLSAQNRGIFPETDKTSIAHFSPNRLEQSHTTTQLCSVKLTESTYKTINSTSILLPAGSHANGINSPRWTIYNPNAHAYRQSLWALLDLVIHMQISPHAHHSQEQASFMSFVNISMACFC